MTSDAYLDLGYIPRFLRASKKRFEAGESHISRFNTQNILLLVTNGVLRFEENGVPVELGRGEYYIQAAGKKQTGDAPSESPEYMFINFTGRFKKKSERALPVRGFFDIERISSHFESIKECERSVKESEDLELLFDRQVIFFDILNALHKRNVSLAQRTSSAQDVYDYISSSFSKDISLEQLSRRFGYSKDHLVRIFKSAYKITPYQYLLQCRICYARLLLSSERLPISNVANLCGFKDYSSFYYAFKRSVGMTPADFRLLCCDSDGQ